MPISTKRPPAIAPDCRARVTYSEQPTELGGTVLAAIWQLRVQSPLAAFEHRPPPFAGLQVIYNLETRKLWLKGPHSHPERSRLAPGSRYCGLRLHPLASRWLVTEAASSLRNRIVLATEFSQRAWWQALEAELAHVADLCEGSAVLADALGRLEPFTFDPRVAWAAGHLTAMHPPRVAELARELGISERQFSRSFSRVVGLSPQVFSSVARVRRGLTALVDAKRRDIAATAIGSGFSDQAHFTRELRRKVGLTPLDFRKRYAGTRFLHGGTAPDD